MKLLQNSFVMSENLLLNSNFTRGGGIQNPLSIKQDSGNVYFLPNYFVSLTGGSFDFTITRSANSLRLTGSLIATSEVSYIDIYYDYAPFNGYYVTTKNRQVTMTLGASIEDKKGNLDRYGSTFKCVPGMSDYNTYMLKAVTNFTRGKKKSFIIYDYSGAIARPYFRLSFQNAQKNENIEFDYVISDLYLYEGAYVNPPVKYDIVSDIGYLPNYYTDPRYCSGYMLPEYFPYHDREYKFTMGYVYAVFVKNPSVPYVSCVLAKGSNAANSNQGHHIITGSLYFYPQSHAVQTNGVFKYDIQAYSVYRKSSTPHWIDKKISCVEDTSFRMTNGTIDTVIPNPSVGMAHNESERTCYFSIHFNPPTGGSISAYNRYNCCFVPKIMGGIEMLCDWQYVNPDMYQ